MFSRRPPRLFALAGGALILASCASLSRPTRSHLSETVPTAGEHIYAVLLNGGAQKQINYRSHLHNIEGFLALLQADGVPSRHITVFNSDGENPAPDMATREAAKDPDLWLLPILVRRAVVPPLTYVNSTVPGVALRPARKEALHQWFAQEGARLGPGDTLIFYVTDHGEKNKENETNNSISLWGESLSVDELRGLLAVLDPQVRVVMVMSQCFSGSFANTIFSSRSTLPAGNVCGYFASTADRPAYGCYPENLGKDGVGHSYRLLEALRSLGDLPGAQQRILVTDESPDVPHATSDFFLRSALADAAAASGKDRARFIDGLLTEAWKDRGRWEPQIRLLDRIGQTYGFFSPRSLAELNDQALALPAVSRQLATYAQRWGQALEALRVENWQRFLESHPEWRVRIDTPPTPAPQTPTREEMIGELLVALSDFTKEHPQRQARLLSLHRKAENAYEASYRMAVRLGVVLRMRAILTDVAGRVYLARESNADMRAAYERLRACEDLDLGRPTVASPSDLDLPPPFPTIAEDQSVVTSVMPAWMGIRYTPVAAKEREKLRLSPGAVRVLTVYPDSPATAAGIHVGDVILGPPDAPFTEPHRILEWTMRSEIGHPRSLKILREGTPDLVRLSPGPYPMALPKLPGPPEVGSAAPPLKIDLLRGAKALAANRPRLLFFWATWCLPCKAALPEVLAFARARGVEVVAITDEDPDTVRAFLKKFEKPFPKIVAIDRYRQTEQSYGVSGTPTIVLLDADGTVRQYQTGYRPDVGLEIDGWHWKKKVLSTEY